MLSSLLWLAQISSALPGVTVTLAWIPSQSQETVGYYVYSLEENATTPTRIKIGNTNTATISGLKEGLRYCFTVTAYNVAGLESVPSNEATYLVPVALRLHPPGSATGLCRVQFPTVPGRIYELQASVDLKNWSTVWQPAMVTGYGTLEYEDPRSRVLSQCFYRLIVR